MSLTNPWQREVEAVWAHSSESVHDEVLARLGMCGTVVGIEHDGDVANDMTHSIVFPKQAAVLIPEERPSGYFAAAEFDLSGVDDHLQVVAGPEGVRILSLTGSIGNQVLLKVLSTLPEQA